MSKLTPEAGEVWKSSTGTLSVVLYSGSSSVIINGDEEWSIARFITEYILYRRADGVKV